MSLRTRMKSLTTEAISYQVNETFLYGMETIYKEMQEFMMSMGDPYKYYKSSHYKERINNLEKILSDRFNVNVIIGYNIESDHFSTYGNGRKNFKSLGRRFDPEKTFKQWSNTDKNLIKDIQAKDLSNENMRTLSNFFSGLGLLGNEELLNNLKDNPISLDFKNVKFVSKPKYYSFYLNHDFVQLLSKKYLEIPLSPMEMVAINIHELGHCWDHISSLFKIGNDIEILQDVIREQVIKENYDFPNIVKIYYDRTGIKEEPSKDISTCLINLNNAILKRSEILNINKVSINVEQQADEFASRFGLGLQSVSAMNKLDKYYDFDNSDMGKIQNQIISNSIVSGTTLIAGVLGIIAGASIIGTGFLLVALAGLTYSVYDIINKIYKHDNDKRYDATIRRMERIKNSTIRRLKFIEDKNIKEEIISDIDHITQLINQMKEQKKDNFIKSTLDKLILKFDTEKQNDKMADMLEDLMSNDIYVGYQKLKMLQEKL